MLLRPPLQASSMLERHFHQVMLLAQGRLVVAGSFDQALQCFEVAGYRWGMGMLWLEAWLGCVHRWGPVRVSCSTCKPARCRVQG